MQLQKGSTEGPITKKLLESLSGVSPSELWCALWAQVDAVGEHYVWRGPKDRQGRGVVAVGKTKLPVAQALWLYDGGEPRQATALAPTCRKRGCVRVEHQRVGGAR